MLSVFGEEAAAVVVLIPLKIAFICFSSARICVEFRPHFSL